MTEKAYRTIITTAGAMKLAEAAVSGEPVGITMMAVGDGNGSQPVPDPEQTRLVNECYRAPLNKLVVADSAANIIEAEMVMQPQVGGFTLREAALFDDAGICIAVANMPPTYKPELAEGAGRFTTVRMWLAVSSTSDIQLIADPGVVLATMHDVLEAGNSVKDYCDDLLSDHEKSRDHPDATLEEKGFTKLSSQTDSDSEALAATPKAVKAAIAEAIRGAWELDNPVGTTRFFNKNLNPNDQWPWSVWVYTGENRTIRIGKSDGTNVGQTGGSDNVTLQRANLPAVQIDVSGETSEQGQQELTTSGNGRHRHRAGDGAPGDAWQDATHGTDNQKYTGWNYTDYAEDHQHSVTIPPHKHSTSGKTASLGEGKSFSVVESHTLLMCWSRVA
ncbi:phage tail protein [Klebsiella quasipneumoniae]|uniref:phage tail protein n=1 Tax=Klebsiella quasipneumoniae TaxID=1463165 RepID=UPI0010916623|nr:phage tail protein [Klebsiella quasipneumoniae]EMB5607437.1 phage tail protein [Klebsiella pneumoniae]VGI73414.1 putative prophage tail fiber protein [Klebsiella quasipneumoniae]HBT8823537.1 phage tail protein [Klebsiella pneumoniae]HBU3856450.1 phage tail protein [Klebsiella pneumoniae]HBU4628702.1 phage tail protein [Klebsiella pneumoniae]